jgi:hypothetical protein
MTDHQHPQPEDPTSAAENHGTVAQGAGKTTMIRALLAADEAAGAGVAASASPVTALPLAVPTGRTTNLRIIADADQQVDHSHQPVPPVSPGGFPYRYKVRLQGANAYAFTADEVLALFIDSYQSQPGRDREAQLEQVKLRGRHCTGVIVNHVAQAMFAGQLSPEEEAVLQRSAEYNTDGDPITVEECPRWDHPEVPMLLMGDLYAPEYGRFEPPLGNVKLIWPGRAERYLDGLAELGLIALSENPAVTASPIVEVRGVEE